LLPRSNVLTKLAELKRPAPAAQRQIPMVFVEVDPAKAAAEPPKETPYYSTQNTLAANPDTSKELEAPKIDGTQTKLVRMMDVTQPQPLPLQPAPPKEPVQEDVEVRPKAKSPEPAGELTLAKPDAQSRRLEGDGEHTLQAEPPKPVREKPRRLADVVQPQAALVGQKMQQPGGVRRFALEAALDVKASPFGDYDRRLILAVQQRWYDLLAEQRFMQDRTGKVVLDFHLTYDGRITDVRVEDNTVGELLAVICQKAVQDPAPFGKWPSDMRKLVGADYREVRFTFYYD
jgi:outer membrane biosynthesis protein TonB